MDKLTGVGIENLASNRTSLGLKSQTAKLETVPVNILLIEPVWD